MRPYLQVECETGDLLGYLGESEVLWICGFHVDVRRAGAGDLGKFALESGVLVLELRLCGG